MTKPNKNVFDLSHDVKLSCRMGELVPTLCMECVPGDKFNISCDSLLRFAPMTFPIMHRCDVTMHYFFVPLRLLWKNWESFITNQAPIPGFPTVEIEADGINYTALMDYLGVPNPTLNALPIPTNETISAMPFAAYQKIWYDYYRDQNLDSQAINWELLDGDNSANIAALTAIQKRAWEHDYFTSALPFAQKGNAVNIPLQTFHDVPVFTNNLGGTVLDGTPTDLSINTNIPDEPIAGTDLYAGTSSLNNDPTSINDLRRAFRLQEWLEKAARGGSRYVENILSHFGVRSSDKRLQRAEYITGTKSPVVISEVLNTTGTVDTPQGGMAGHAVSVTAGKYGGYFCEEHGYIMGIMSIMPKTAYMQGIPKHFLKTTDPFQYYWPSFANIGEQEIQNREIYAFHEDGDMTFGYIPRYAEYKFENNRVAGEFRDSLIDWHMARKFTSLPALNSSFIQADPTTRIFAVTASDEQNMWCHILHKIRAVRAMPKYGNPSF